MKCALLYFTGPGDPLYPSIARRATEGMPLLQARHSPYPYARASRYIEGDGGPLPEHMVTYGWACTNTTPSWADLPERKTIVGGPARTELARLI